MSKMADLAGQLEQEFHVKFLGMYPLVEGNVTVLACDIRDALDKAYQNVSVREITSINKGWGSRDD